MKSGMIVAAASLWLALGCEATPPAPETALAEGLTVQVAEPGFRTVAAYREGEHVVHIETRRAERTPAEYLAQDPTLPEFGVDVRITDAAGSLIYARIAGDGADFADDDVAPPADRALRERDIAVAHAGLAALTSESARSLQAGSFGVERAALREVAHAFDVTTADDTAALEEIEASELGGVSAAAVPTTWKHRVALWKVHCCVPGGYHSATRVDNYSGTYWSAQVDWCNHGRCPQGDGMTSVCSYTSGWRNGLARVQKCSTGQGESPYSHNCNDDSHLEVIDVRHNKLYSTNDGSCHDFGANPNPDGCNPSTW